MVDSSIIVKDRNRILMLQKRLNITLVNLFSKVERNNSFKILKNNQVL